ncbi:MULTISPECIES: MFS transporter [Roseomonadaceae]|jgi:predicted MFS family arabinose efflux permease|uniref:MFS transporter n=1 Tax=Roseicella frigidaeris TaxID=2230885 RepID=A0A327LXC6_9PROT|nr:MULTISPECIES: MFS transporter [Acetobacteraceae]RAI55319.1 MFS transporter [Roseicella frigidaeris]CAH0129548.1 Riboflavin transporter RfnT [Roseomonas sp. CECT 9278]
MTTTHQTRNVLLLASAQALFQTASVLVMTVAALAATHLAPAPWLVTAPIAAMFLGTAAATFPASMLMARRGRRYGFLIGAALGVLGGLCGAAGIWTGSLVLLGFGTLLIGAYQGFAQFYRFAAAEVADAAFRPRAISYVLAGGVFAAIVGPELGRHGGPLLEPEFTGSFLLLSVVSLLAMRILLGLRMPAAPPAAAVAGAATPRPLGSIVRQPSYLVALFGAATGYGVMILAMTATPLAMIHHEHGIADAARVIQAHTLGMFLPSFFTGSLIARFGVLRIMLTGVVVLCAHVGMTLTGTGFHSFVAALVLLGVGWNFLYIGGTTLLTETYTQAERARAQAANDLTIFAVGLASSLAAGAMLDRLGWQMLNIVLLPWLTLAAAAIVALGLVRRRRLRATA